MWLFLVPVWAHCSPFFSIARRSPTECGFGKVPSMLLCSHLENEQFGLDQWFQLKKIKIKKQSIRIPCSNTACAETHQTGVIWAEIGVAGWPPPCSASRVAPEVAPQTPRTPRDHFKHPSQMFPKALPSSRCYSSVNSKCHLFHETRLLPWPTWIASFSVRGSICEHITRPTMSAN